MEEVRRKRGKNTVPHTTVPRNNRITISLNDKELEYLNKSCYDKDGRKMKSRTEMARLYIDIFSGYLDHCDESGREIDDRNKKRKEKEG